MTERTVEEIKTRLKAVDHIEISDNTTGQKFYGYKLGVGDSTLSEIWRCTDDNRHPDHAAHVAAGGDVADLYCDSHYASVDDEAAFTFLLNAKKDIAFLLEQLARVQPLPEEWRSAGRATREIDATITLLNCADQLDVALRGESEQVKSLAALVEARL
ncbi:hypothetical protein EHF33_20465 (plasmid) [Deinococcus psychrotolerans]|uniref:Uncharacterized protein n=1 Tax=Deinococcus psychrotolerans TaxID=2489213 RepID=A0A3G8YVT1_9DEIO|nr:hypothetical protein [Deinococcus psychrotolerans]AZI45286.1 hypothetical protein EHF33_20465 [Deinococcus psychrotolerans]